VKFVKSKPARVDADRATGDVILHGVDTEGYHRYAARHDLAILAIGMEPSVRGADIPAEVLEDSSGFLQPAAPGSGIFGAGCATNALDVNRAVQSSTAAALRAIQVVNRVARAES
jgi:quinone-modifying oxidoreductase, subunit QmoA